MFWTFRIMVGLGFYFILLFAAAFWYASHRDFSPTWLLRLMMMSLPLPWVAAELGWFVAEYGRQPWAIDGILPTFLAVSSLSAAQVLFTLAGLRPVLLGVARGRRHADAQIRADGTGGRARTGAGAGRPAAVPAE